MTTYARLSITRGVRSVGPQAAVYTSLRIWLLRTTVGYRAARSAMQANVVNAEFSIYETERGCYLTVGRVRGESEPPGLHTPSPFRMKSRQHGETGKISAFEPSCSRNSNCPVGKC